MKNIKLLALAFLGSVIVFTVGCTEEVTPDDDPVVNTTYDADVAAILNASCASVGCHNDTSASGSLANYTDAKAFAGYGRILGAIKHDTGYTAMPYGKDKLSDENIATVESWITDGLLEN